MTLSLADPVVSRYFRQEGDGWRSEVAPGALIRGGMLSFYQTVPAPGSYAGISLLGLPLTDETDVPGHPGVKVTLFERGAVAWDVNHELDHPVGVNGPAYLLQRSQVAQCFPSLEAANADAATMQAQLAAVQQQLADAEAELAKARTQLADMGSVQASGGPSAEEVQAAKDAQTKAEQDRAAASAKATALEQHIASLPTAEDMAALQSQIEALTKQRDAAEAAAIEAQKRLLLVAQLRDGITMALTLPGGEEAQAMAAMTITDAPSPGGALGATASVRAPAEEAVQAEPAPASPAETQPLEAVPEPAAEPPAQRAPGPETPTTEESAPAPVASEAPVA